jgi:uncharacterized protein YbaA (DUF1428 family)
LRPINPNSNPKEQQHDLFEGFVVPVPAANRGAYQKHATEFAPLAQEMGVEHMLEAWESDVPEGKITDFRKAVDAKADEKIVFSFFEYGSKAARDAANEKFMSDERMKDMGANMPFDGKRMIMGGFEAIVDEGGERGGFVDGWVVPVPTAKRDAYRELAAKNAKYFLEYGANRIVEAFGDDVPKGQVTDFYRAVKAEDGESVVFAFIEWPDKGARDAAWPKIMEDERMRPTGDIPFNGQRMFWGGFEKILDTAEARATASAEA